MKELHIRLPEELIEKLQERASNNNRSVNGEIITILGSAVIGVPIIGTIKDGGVEWNDKSRAEFEEYKKGILDPRD